MDELRISVSDMTGLQLARPVRGGVPLARGAAPADSRFLLHDESGTPVPLQAAVIGRWDDGSARWVLLDFEARPPAGGTQTYTLRWAGDAASPKPQVPVQVDAQPQAALRSGSIEVTPATNALLRISDRIDVRLVVTDREGERCEGIVESAEIETCGELRSTIVIRGAFQTAQGKRLFGFRLWASVFAGRPQVHLEPLILIDADSGVVQRVREVCLELAPRHGVKSANLGGEPGWMGNPQPRVRLLQVDDEKYVFEGAAGEGAKAPGWAEFDDGEGTVAVALRDFWQQWPKSIEADGASLKIGLFPSFGEGLFGHMGPWYKHDYLFEGDCYRLRTGQARRWQVWVDLDGDGASLARAANAPLVPAADPAQAIGTDVWGEILPAGHPAMLEYDEWADNLFEAYCRSIELQRDYGAMNWGDWWGERNCNWGNHEYDTPKQILVQFARTGDPKYFHAGDTAARHTSEVDVIHHINEDLRRYFEEDMENDPTYPCRPGMVHEHSIGHVGGFHSVDRIRELYVSLGIGKTDEPYLCLDPYNLGHIFTQGMAYHYFLTGDPWVKETVNKIGANLAQLVEDREYQFKGWSHCGRTNGWTMLAIAGAHDMDPQERYLQAMRLLADDALGEQDPNCGGWLYELPWGHCYCTTRKHVGEAGFITAVRLNGLSRYHELTGDERIPEAVGRGITHLNNDTWRDEASAWRYTSCPMTAAVNQYGVTVMALASSVKMVGNPEHLRILRKAWQAKFERLKSVAESLSDPEELRGFGKTYSSSMYGCPEAVSLLARIAEEEGSGA